MVIQFMFHNVLSDILMCILMSSMVNGNWCQVWSMGNIFLTCYVCIILFWSCLTEQLNLDWYCICRYFTVLQKELEPYDCILYEMVASRESLDSRKSSISRKKLKSSRSKGFNIIGFIQRQMARFLTLDFQLDCLDYEGENWYHADLDFETFKLLQVLYVITLLPSPLLVKWIADYSGC